MHRNPDKAKRKSIDWPSILGYMQAAIAFMLLISVLLNFAYCEIYNNGFSDMVLMGKEESGKYYLFLGGKYQQTSASMFVLLRQWSWAIIIMFSSLFLLAFVIMAVKGESIHQEE